MSTFATIRIDDIKDKRVKLYTEYSEPQLYHINEPDAGIFIAETPMVIERAMSMGAKPVSFFAESSSLQNGAVKEILEKAGDAPVFEAELSVINAITGFNLTRGLLAAFERPDLPEPEDLLENAGCVAVLEDIVNPTNVGAIFRSAAALGADAVLMTRRSTDPFYRRSARVSMGTVFMIPWAYILKDTDVTDLLHNYGFTVISLALTENAVPLTDPVLKKNPRKALIFGAEGSGLKEETIAASDHVAIIPMANGVDSLNVAASSAVAFWELCGREGTGKISGVCDPQE
ncbi:MAG: RNA methyltransferase [Lachnospiraceae bacterium]|nr:RNA methyltransferase [Lachnospiraceae bacterium]